MGLREKDKHILKEISSGNWEAVLPRKVYRQVTEWLDRRDKKDFAVVRFVFKDSIIKKRFACHIICHTDRIDEKVKVKEICILPPQAWDDHPDKILSYPEELHIFPVFNMPHDILKRARRKYNRQQR